MTIEPLDSIEQYLLDESSELLATIEQNLLELLEEKTVDKVHTLMRSAHTIKGSAANYELKTLETIAHHLEDVFQALYAPELEIDSELSFLLLEGYDCLKVPLNGILSNIPYDEQEILDRTAEVFAKLQTKLGDFFGREAPLPTSEELGFDVVGLIFADSVPQDLQQLETAIATQDPQQVYPILNSKADFFQELGMSYDLPGLVEIAQATKAAIEYHKDHVLTIAQIALENFQQAYTAVLDGERNQGGSLCDQLRYWAESSAENSLIVSEEQDNNTVNNSHSNLTEELLNIVDDSVEDNSLIVSGEQEKEEEEESSYIREIKQKVNQNLSLNASPIERVLQLICTTHKETFVKKEPNISSENNQQKFQPKKQSTQSLPSIRVAVKQLDRLSHTIGELLISENQQSLQSDQIHHLTQNTLKQFLLSQKQLNKVREWSDKNLLIPSSKRSKKHKKKNDIDPLIISTSLTDIDSEFDVLEMDVYSDLHLLLQNLTEQMMQLGEQIESIEGLAQTLRFSRGKRKQLLSQAQDDLLEARMVPLAKVFNRFPRLMQQMVAAHQKPAQLHLIGSDVLIDKVFVEKLYEPLLHLIRNAYDHGLESAEKRRQQGKPETGQITVEAYHQGNRITIEIRDDGQGLDWERIRQSAVEKQLLTPEEAANLSEEQLADLLFEPGFSTTEKISQLSGRGIGLDVVRSQFQAWQGSVSIKSNRGEGTTFAHGVTSPLNP